MYAQVYQWPFFIGLWAYFIFTYCCTHRVCVVMHKLLKFFTLSLPLPCCAQVQLLPPAPTALNNKTRFFEGLPANIQQKLQYEILRMAGFFLLGPILLIPNFTSFHFDVTQVCYVISFSCRFFPSSPTCRPVSPRCCARVCTHTSKVLLSDFSHGTPSPPLHKLGFWASFCPVYLGHPLGSAMMVQLFALWTPTQCLFLP